MPRNATLGFDISVRVDQAGARGHRQHPLRQVRASAEAHVITPARSGDGRYLFAEGGLPFGTMLLLFTHCREREPPPRNLVVYEAKKSWRHPYLGYTRTFLKIKWQFSGPLFLPRTPAKIHTTPEKNWTSGECVNCHRDGSVYFSRR